MINSKFKTESNVLLSVYTHNNLYKTYWIGIVKQNQPFGHR